MICIGHVMPNNGWCCCWIRLKSTKIWNKYIIWHCRQIVCNVIVMFCFCFVKIVRFVNGFVDFAIIAFHFISIKWWFIHCKTGIWVRPAIQHGRNQLIGISISFDWVHLDKFIRSVVVPMTQTVPLLSVCVTDSLEWALSVRWRNKSARMSDETVKLNQIKSLI